MSREWAREAACRGMDPAESDRVFFPAEGPSSKPDYTEALSMCNRCAVKDECASAALEVERGVALSSRFGVFGGLTPRERWARSRDGALLDGEKRCVWCEVPFTPKRLGQIACSRECGGSYQAKQARERMARQRANRHVA